MEGKVPGSIEKALVIGCGYHARGNLIPAMASAGLFNEILIYDLYEESFDGLKSGLAENDLKKISFYDKWSKFEQELSAGVLAVVSTPADSHLYYFEKLVNRGVQFIYIEKPLAQSLKDIDAIYSLSENASVKVACGFYNSYIDPVVSFSDYQRQYNLGNLCSVKAYGGNNDLSAFGIHIIDLANVLFDSYPINVFASITGTTVNPRGEKYFYHGGSIFLTYPEIRELTISYHPASFISNRVQLIFKYGLIEFEYIDQSTMKIYSIQDKTEGRPFYRHQPAELIDEIKLNFDWLQYFSNIFVNMLSGDNYPDLKRNIISTQGLISALVSNDMGKRLELPVDAKNPYYDKQYPIT